jgi:hypothetical protein
MVFRNNRNGGFVRRAAMRNILFVLLFSAALAPSATAQILLHHSRQPEPISLDSLDSSPRRVFIQFQEAPLYRVSGDRFKTASVDVYTSRLNTFLTDAGIVGIQADEANRNHVYKLVHGLERELTERDIQRFSEFGYVKTIHRVGEYTTTETPWASAIRAPQAWTQFDTRGASVRIGIIDSGVDGTHPDLASNIRGGWDFVDQDADPSDPNGHGTHVAGIVLSVAPDADLHAYRVLDQRGRGSVAAIIQALEKSVDDGMHVVNMSLGSDIGSPFDPVSQAVDQAVRMGVVVVVSAGNSGYLNPSGDPNSFRNNGSLTIGSPGSAADAITVGSASLTGQISAFSSKGPAMVDFHPKPDVVAPGEDVLSAIPGGGRATKSGTSMAAPHVAGLAALMVSRRPDWSPAQVKSAILSSSSRLQAPAFHQGAGMVDAVNALSATTLVIPSSFAFGRVPSTEATVWVYNTSAVFKSYTASVIGAEAGVVIGVTPQQFSLAAGDSLQIRATVQISEGMHPNVSGNIRFFGGRVELVSDGVVAAIPWSVAKSSIMVLQFSDPDPYVVGSAWDGYFTSD